MGAQATSAQDIGLLQAFAVSFSAEEILQFYHG